MNADISPRGSRYEELLSRIHDGAWLDSQTFPPLQWAVPGLIAEGMGLLVGPPKLGKSWFALGIGLAVAQGGYALGRIRVEQRPVLYAALEDGNRRMQYRCRHLLDDQPIPSGFQYFTDARGADEALAILTAWLDRHPGGLVMLDTLGKVLPSAAPGQSTYERDYAIGSVLKGIVDDHPGSAFLVVHHTRKMGSTDFMDATSGTNGLNGSADYTVVLERARGEDSARIKVTGRDVTEGEYAARMPSGTWLLDGDDLTQAAETARTERATDGLGDDSAQVVAFIGEHPEGVTPAQVAARMGWPDNKTRTYLARLLDGGRVNRPSRGRYTPVASVASVAFNGDGEEERNNATPSVAFQHPTSPAEITHATEATRSSTPPESPVPGSSRGAVGNPPTPVWRLPAETPGGQDPTCVDSVTSGDENRASSQVSPERSREVTPRSREVTDSHLTSGDLRDLTSTNTTESAPGGHADRQTPPVTSGTTTSTPGVWTDPEWNACTEVGREAQPIDGGDRRRWRAAGRPPIAVPEVAR